MLALRTEPERRYRSASQFGDDIRRYLAGLPVAARRDHLALPQRQVRAPPSLRRGRGRLRRCCCWSGYAARLDAERAHPRRAANGPKRPRNSWSACWSMFDTAPGAGSGDQTREDHPQERRGARRPASSRAQPELQAVLRDALGPRCTTATAITMRHAYCSEQALAEKRAQLGEQNLSFAQTLSALVGSVFRARAANRVAAAERDAAAGARHRLARSSARASLTTANSMVQLGRVLRQTQVSSTDAGSALRQAIQILEQRRRHRREPERGAELPRERAAAPG